MHQRHRQTDRQTTDNRQTTDGRLIAYSDREREFTFAKNYLVRTIASRGNEIASRYQEMLSGGNEMLSRSYEMLPREHEIKQNFFCMSLRGLRKEEIC